MKILTAIARTAAQLCDAHDAQIYLVEGATMRLVAQHGSVRTTRRLGELFPVSRGAVHGRAVLTRRAIHVRDLKTAVRTQYPELTPRQRATGTRTILAAPLLSDGAAVGVIMIRRVRVNPFTSRQIALLKTFADQAVIAIENVRLFKELEARNRDLTEALEQQTATSEVLKVISRSTFDLEPVLRTLVENAVRLCAAEAGFIYRFEAGKFLVASEYGTSPEIRAAVGRTPIQPGRGSVTGRAALELCTVHVPDVLADPDYEPNERQQAIGNRTTLAVPMQRQGALRGIFALWKTRVEPFTDKQIALVRTFADQAVIAIENVRLFAELEARNQELIESLQRQTATSEILGVISRSPTDVEPVFATILGNATRLCEASFCILWRWDGEALIPTAHANLSPELVERLLTSHVRPHEGGSPVALTALEQTVIHVADVLDDPRFSPADVPFYQLAGARSILSVPMLREGSLVGVINTGRREPRAFSDTQVALLKTFADQAVIAIENVRLFKELEVRNRDLTEALEQQTATSEILRVISSSPTDLQPVFDMITRNAVRLCDGINGHLYRFDGERIHLAAAASVSGQAWAEWQQTFPRPLSEGGGVRHVIETGQVLNLAEFEDFEGFTPAARGLWAATGIHSVLLVPIMLQGEAIGAIVVNHRDVGAFSDAQVELLKTFADQAVIAIENVRLFKELEARTQDLTRSVGELRALGEVGQAISSALNLQTVLSTIAARATQLSGTDAGVIYEYDEQREIFVPRATEHLEADIVATMLATPVRKGEGATGRLAETQEPIQVPDVLAAPAESRVRSALVSAGYRALLAVPLVREGHLLGGLTVIRKATGAFAPEAIELLRTFATQSALAIQNARLFEEIADKSRQLEAASRHKSEFLANMSHELRTPLNAVIGFSEVLLQRMFGDLNDKQDEYLKDIYASGQHLLSLINDVLDLSKIEAGRMELAPAPFHLPSALDNAVTLVRERAARHGITLQLDLDPRLGEIVGDERKVKQVLLNLLSNAVKFTPEGGRISLKAARRDDVVELAVTDTGIGIAPEDQTAIFEEFRQVGHDETRKQEGTGLGLTLAKKFVELHGGRIWVESEVGCGATFTFTLPVA